MANGLIVTSKEWADIGQNNRFSSGGLFKQRFVGRRNSSAVIYEDELLSFNQSFFFKSDRRL